VVSGITGFRREKKPWAEETKKVVRTLLNEGLCRKGKLVGSSVGSRCLFGWFSAESSGGDLTVPLYLRRFEPLIICSLADYTRNVPVD
jgi:hypothetical protein